MYTQFEILHQCDPKIIFEICSKSKANKKTKLNEQNEQKLIIMDNQIDSIEQPNEDCKL